MSHRFLFLTLGCLLPLAGWGADPQGPAEGDLSQVRRERLTVLLPQLLMEKRLDCWLAFTREGATDPLLKQLGSDHMVARAALIFCRTPSDYRRIAIAASYDVEPLISSALYDTVIAYRSEGIKPHLQAVMQDLNPRKIAVNYSRDVPMGDGLTVGMYRYLEETLPRFRRRLVSAEELIISLFSRKLPSEVAALREAAEKTQLILGEALSERVITPGVTTELDVANYLRRRAGELGLTESCMSIVAGPRRGHSDPSQRVLQRGDLVRADVCFRARGYSSDIQRTAYVLRTGETEPPDFVLKLWNDAVAANRAALAAIRPGVTGNDVDRAGRGALKVLGYEGYPHAAGHPLGPQVHDIGPLLAPDWPERYGNLGFFELEPAMVLAVEPLLYADEPRLGGAINVGIEEDILVTETGYEVLGSLQKDLWVIK
ncbi:MAG: M24 family metallopeptidase [Candidatus Neomarinimicrobiota bacterium]